MVSWRINEARPKIYKSLHAAQVVIIFCEDFFGMRKNEEAKYNGHNRGDSPADFLSRLPGEVEVLRRLECV